MDCETLRRFWTSSRFWTLKRCGIANDYRFRFASMFWNRFLSELVE